MTSSTKQSGSNGEGQNGFSTLEVLVAMAILILAMSGVILVSFGNQSIVGDSQTEGQALNLAQQLLENEQALARQDFSAVASIAEVQDGVYKKKVDVSNWTDPVTSVAGKKVVATVNWTSDHNRPQTVQLTALVTNFQNP